MGTKYPVPTHEHDDSTRARVQHTTDGENIAHMQDCTDPDCQECLMLTEWYSGCAGCDSVGHTSTFHYDSETGDYYCESCYARNRADGPSDPDTPYSYYRD
jgi:hypothetical protein